jgi:phosphatidylglycerophosphate synthase
MNPSLDRVVILADESANWKIAGLRQLDRLVLALNEFAKSMIGESKIDIFIFWRPDMAIEKRWRPSDPRLTRCNILEFSESALPGDRVLNTRLLVKRSGLETFLHDSVSIDLDHSIVNESALWKKLWRQFENIFQEAQAQQKRESWRYVRHRSDIPCCERWLLRDSGKSRDGYVSRYLNRPISRTVSQFLLKTSMTPNLWTWLITAFPLIGFLFLIRGTYPGFVIGALLFNVHSILDGCDGEIARAKYLDSEKGPGIDAIGDLISLLLFSIGLGGGLSRSAQQDAVSHWVFLSEGILTFVFLALRLGPDHVLDLFRRGPAAVAFSKNDERLQRSGGRIFGARFTSWGFELTKRDVVFFAFLIAAVLGLARWILHLLFIYALVTLILSWRGRAGRETMA